MVATAPHHYALPEAWTLLCGREPQDHYGLKSDKLQVIYNCTSEPWKPLRSFVVRAPSVDDKVHNLSA